MKEEFFAPLHTLRRRKKDLDNRLLIPCTNTHTFVFTSFISYVRAGGSHYEENVVDFTILVAMATSSGLYAFPAIHMHIRIQCTKLAFPIL